MDSFIIGSVDWVDVTTLPDPSPERARSRAVGYLSLPTPGSRCTAFLVAPDIVMTNQHCAPSEWAATNATVYFRREAGVPSSGWAGYDCSTLIGNDVTLDYALLRCSGRPGDTFGVLDLDPQPPARGDDIYIVHQNCDYYTSPGCAPTKKLSRGEVTRTVWDLEHNADTLGGSSGSPVLGASTHLVTAIHHAGCCNDGNGRGTTNFAVQMSRIVPDIAQRFPEVVLGSATPAPTPPVPNPAPSSDRFEPNDTAADATLAGDGFVEGQLFVDSSDRDVFVIDLVAESSISVAIHFQHMLGDLDAKLYVGSTTTTPLLSAVSVTDDELLEAPALAPGRYFVEVYGYASATNAYDIAVSVTPTVAPPPPPPPAPPSDLEPNDDMGSAPTVALPFAQASFEIADAADVDYYAFDASTGSIRVEVTFTHAVGDLDLYLYDQQGTVIARSIGVTDQELIQSSLAPGRYAVKIYGYAQAIGPYDLSITE